MTGISILVLIHAHSARGHGMLEEEDDMSEFEEDDSSQEDFILFTQKVNYCTGVGLICQ